MDFAKSQEKSVLFLSKDASEIKVTISDDKLKWTGIDIDLEKNRCIGTY